MPRVVAELINLFARSIWLLRMHRVVRHVRTKQGLKNLTTDEQF